MGPVAEGSIVHRRLLVDLKRLFPWFEYVVRAGWTPDGRQVRDTYGFSPSFAPHLL